jgi:carbamate kinase
MAMEIGRRLVVAIGGNAILRDGQKGTAEEQLANLEVACVAISGLVRPGVDIVLTHGNGPQVGNILVQNEAARDDVPALPLDVCGAQSQGSLGYLIQQTLAGVLEKKGIRRDVVSLVTQTVVDVNDPAFQKPTKPVGPYYGEEQARLLSSDKGWKLKEIKEKEAKEKRFRRVVASPQPQQIVEAGLIRKMVRLGAIVIAAGGGGIPVVKRADGGFSGVEAVIDKDLASATLARDIKADTLMLLTDVEKVFLDFRKPGQRAIGQMTVADATRYLAEGQFPAGSMGPKMEAAVRFLSDRQERSLDSFMPAGSKYPMQRRKVIITSLRMAAAAAQGKTGTIVVPE